MEPQDAEYPIRPCHINTQTHFWGAFGNCETEISANWIVRLCQKRGDWGPFPFSELEALYNERGHTGITLNNLSDAELAMSGKDSETGRVLPETILAPTHRFVSGCFKAAPATEQGGQ
jgi:hypothetical protein